MKRPIYLLLVAILITSMLTGCGSEETNTNDPLAQMSKEELLEYSKVLENDLASAYVKIDEMEQKMTGIFGEETQTAGITEFSDNSGRMTLVTLDDTIKLPKPFEFPVSTQSYNASAISITDNVYVKPSPNWTISLSGTQIDLYHSGSKISGIIKVGNRDKTQKSPQISEIKDTIIEFFNSMPQTTVQTSKIYTNETWAGTDAVAKTFIDEEDAQIRCGMFSLGDTNITYFFSYKGQPDSGKDELVLTLLQTMTIFGQPLRIE